MQKHILGLFCSWPFFEILFRLKVMATFWLWNTQIKKQKVTIENFKKMAKSKIGLKCVFSCFWVFFLNIFQIFFQSWVFYLSFPQTKVAITFKRKRISKKGQEQNRPKMCFCMLLGGF